MNTHEEIIRRLADICLEEYPYELIRKLLIKLERFGQIVTILLPGKMISRARRNTNSNPRYYHISDLSYKPQEDNNRYYRASTPYRTMFYGSYLPEMKAKHEINSEKITLIYELCDLMRSKDSVGEQKITIGNWEILEKISLVTIFQHMSYQRPALIATELNKGFQSFLKDYPELINASRNVTNFLASKFAKEETQEDYDYMISAIFTELITEKEYDGIVYPSVRMSGEGINIALTPESADKKLAFISASEHTLFKNGLKASLSNERIIYPNTHNGIDYFKINRKYYFSLLQAKSMVGL